MATFLVSAFIIVLSIAVRGSIRLIPGRFQVMMESMVDFFYDQLQSAWGSDDKRAKLLLPLIVALFLLIFIANQFSIIPLVASLMNEGQTLFRTPTSDLSLPLTLAVVMVGGAHLVAFTRHPFRHLGNYFKFHLLLRIRSVKDALNAFLELFLGLLDIVGEFAKVISISCRLFGNIFAGEVMHVVITWLTAYLLPMPFIFLSIFSGLVQAFVFTILAINFSASIVKSSEPSRSYS
ncbi:MAG: FoF1 ATP synthase subunit a [bacterium]|nr:FoF1 ATP synthase subunit a [bacterium]